MPGPGKYEGVASLRYVVADMGAGLLVVGETGLEFTACEEDA